MVTLRFFGGTIELHGLGEQAPELPSGGPWDCRWDARTACHRLPALLYPDLLRTLVRQQLAVDDQARQYPTLAHGALVSLRDMLEARPGSAACQRGAVCSGR